MTNRLSLNSRQTQRTDFSLSFLQHKMWRVFSRRMLRHGKSKGGKVETGKQGFTLAEYDRCKCKVQGVYQPSLQILTHCGDAASDFHILVARCLFRELQRLFDSAGNKVEGRPAFHHQRLTLIMRQNKSWRM